MEICHAIQSLCVNMKKIKFLISGIDLDVLMGLGMFPCSVCRSWVGNNSIECTQCKFWVHKRCSGIKGRLVHVPDYMGPRDVAVIPVS